MKYFVIIAAAGNSSRFQSGNKLLKTIANKKVIDYSMEIFDADENCVEILVACGKEIKEYLAGKKNEYHKPITLIDGGDDRSESVWNCIKNHPTGYFVLIHDGARPYLHQALIERLISQLNRFEGVVPGLPVTDTIKTLNPFNNVLKTLERKRIASIQTPQAFQYDKLYDAYALYEKTRTHNQVIYDDSQIMEMYGHGCFVKVIEGDYDNIKITYSHDIADDV